MSWSEAFRFAVDECNVPASLANWNTNVRDKDPVFLVVGSFCPISKLKPNFTALINNTTSAQAFLVRTFLLLDKKRKSICCAKDLLVL